LDDAVSPIQPDAVSKSGFFGGVKKGNLLKWIKGEAPPDGGSRIVFKIFNASPRGGLFREFKGPIR